MKFKYVQLDQLKKIERTKYTQKKYKNAIE